MCTHHAGLARKATGMSDKRSRLNAAIDRLADQIENGHLLASMGGEDLLNEAADKIDTLAAKLEAVRSVLRKYASVVITHPHVSGWVNEIDAILAGRGRDE
jgi:hypothetical protein